MTTKIIGFQATKGSIQSKKLRTATFLDTKTINIASLNANTLWESVWKQIPDRLQNSIGIFVYKIGVKSEGEQLHILESDDGINTLNVASSIYDNKKPAIDNKARNRLIIQARPKTDYIKVIYQNGNIAQTNIKILINIYRMGS